MTKTFSELLKEARRELEYYVTGAIVDFTESVAKRMTELGVNRAELAERIDSSPQYVTKILRGNANFTIQSMAKLARALDSDLQVRLTDERKHEWQTTGEAMEDRTIVQFDYDSSYERRTNFQLSRDGGSFIAPSECNGDQSPVNSNETISTAA